MRVAIMQPYLFPYVGYFHLLHSVDCFILLDDVAYIKKGWINRNRILVNGMEYVFSIPLANSSQNKLIKDTCLQADPRHQRKLLATIEQAYKSSLSFDYVYPLVKQVLLSPENDLTNLIFYSLQLIADYTSLHVQILRSSNIAKDNKLTGQERIIEICKCVKAHDYVNMISGAKLYSPSQFLKAGINLHFLEPILTPYTQFQHDFVSGLSIIDLLMHVSDHEVSDYLQAYTIH
jgi:hypothetical protein